MRDNKEHSTDTSFLKISCIYQKQKVEPFCYLRFTLISQAQMKILSLKKREFPVKTSTVGDTGVEPVTSTTSMWRSTN